MKSSVDFYKRFLNREIEVEDLSNWQRLYFISQLRNYGYTTILSLQSKDTIISQKLICDTSFFQSCFRLFLPINPKTLSSLSTNHLNTITSTSKRTWKPKHIIKYPSLPNLLKNKVNNDTYKREKLS